MYRPPPVPTIAAAAMFALLVSLGFWQLDRAEQKRDLRSAFADAMATDPRQTRGVEAIESARRFEPVAFDARYVPERQALLDAQVHAGRAGYRVWTPAEMDGGGWVIVDRGWVPGAADRTVLPDIDVGDARRAIRGFVAPLPEPGIRLGAGDAGDPSWPRRLTWPDGAALARTWGREMPERIVLLHPADPDGYVREWDPVAIPPERHTAYALQWFALAAALAVIFIVLVSRKREDG